MNRLNTTPEKLESKIKQYYEEGGRNGKKQRLGEFLWNTFGTDHSSWVDYFHEENDLKVLEKIRKEVHQNG
jgi:hypothetical protein